MFLLDLLEALFDYGIVRLFFVLLVVQIIWLNRCCKLPTWKRFGGLFAFQAVCTAGATVGCVRYDSAGISRFAESMACMFAVPLFGGLLVISLLIALCRVPAKSEPKLRKTEQVWPPAREES